MLKMIRCGGLEDLAGRWKVSREDGGELESQTEVTGNVVHTSIRELNGLVVVLDAQGDVSWEVPPGAPDGVLLFETNSAHMHKDNLTFLGGTKGWSLTFKVKGEPEAGWMVLESDSVEEDVDFTLSLAKESSSVELVDGHFSLKKALEDSFFSDLTFDCLSGGKVQAHRAVLAAAYPAMQETDWQALFKTQSADMARILLSCIYSDCLPLNLTVARAQQLVTWISEQPLLKPLSSLASAFVEANDLKQKMIGLIDELLTLLQDAKRTVATLVMADSAKVKYTIKQLSKDAVLGGCKLCLLCQLYVRNKRDMGRSDSREVLEYLRARVVRFMDLVKELAAGAVNKWETLSHENQKELATELIPDIEQAWDLFLKYAKDLKSSVDHPVERSSSDSLRGARVNMVLHLLSRSSERKRLAKIRKEFLESLEMAQGKRERWERYSEEEKAEQVLHVVSKLVTEAEDLQETMETRKRQLLLQNGLEWKSFRSYVDITCMYMTWGLQKVLALKQPLKKLLYEGLKFVGRSEVNEAAVYLGLLGEEELETWLEVVGGDSSGELPKSLSRLQPGLEPPTASVLAQGCMQLASSLKYADMEFVLEETVIPAHRVIVASRCEWACRALQSGMREEKERRIIVSDVEEEVFRLFLYFLYGGSLHSSTMATGTVVDLLTVADRFESRSLLSSCEALLVDRIDDSSVFQLLRVAETFPTHRLREASLQYILRRPTVIVDVDGFSSLSEELCQEIRDLLSGTQDPTLALRHSQPCLPTTSHTREADSSGASSEDEEELQLESHPLAWDVALDSLRAVIGSEVAEDVLHDLLLAADMDINRAVNFFFNTCVQ